MLNMQHLGPLKRGRKHVGGRDLGDRDLHFPGLQELRAENLPRVFRKAIPFLSRA